MISRKPKIIKRALHRPVKCYMSPEIRSRNDLTQMQPHRVVINPQYLVCVHFF